MLKLKFMSLAGCLAGVVLASAPALAGESLSFSYGPLIRSLKISSLKHFANDISCSSRQPSSGNNSERV